MILLIEFDSFFKVYDKDNFIPTSLYTINIYSPRDKKFNFTAEFSLTHYSRQRTKT